MPHPDVTRDDVLATLKEFDDLGRHEFLTKYHYSEARDYFINHDGRFYDSKAIEGVAHKVRHGEPLRSDDFNGGAATVAARLRKLGFTVSEPNPPWTRDEIILACDLVRQNNWHGLNDANPAVIELSNLLQKLPLHARETRGPTFRNPNGVARKTADIATQHPDYPGTRTHGNKLDASVLHEFLANPEEMAAEAAAIRSIAATGKPIQVAELDLDDAAADEGGLLLRRHLARERDPKLRRKKITAARHATGYIACEVCGFDFQRTYGDRGTGFIECHHRIPLHKSGTTSTKLEHLALLCSNCHRMIHRGTPWLTVEQLSALVASRRAST